MLHSAFCGQLRFFFWQMIEINAWKINFLANFSLGSGAIDFSNTLSTLAVKILLHVTVINGLFYDFCKLSAKEFALIFFSVFLSFSDIDS